MEKKSKLQKLQSHLHHQLLQLADIIRNKLMKESIAISFLTMMNNMIIYPE